MRWQGKEGIRDLWSGTEARAQSGLGFLLQQSSLLVQTNRVFVVLAVFGILGYLSDRAFRLATSRALSRYLEAHGGA